MKKALLFINGEPPETLPNYENYSLIACTDGAFHYLKEKNFNFEKLNFLCGDFDSFSQKEEILKEYEQSHFQVITTPDQDKTDFHKALEILMEKNVSCLDVYGGSGKEMDHFLGNLTAAYQFKDQLQLTFFDEFSHYFFAPKFLTIENIAGKTVSLYPFPVAKNVRTKGLQWPLNNEDLEQTKRVGTRNIAVENLVEILFSDGALVVFVSK